MSAVARIPKPQLKGLLYSQIKKNLIIIGVVSTIYAAGHRVFVCEARKARFAEFNRTYDPDAAFERLKARGVFQTC